MQPPRTNVERTDHEPNQLALASGDFTEANGEVERERERERERRCRRDGLLACATRAAQGLQRMSARALSLGRGRDA
eukprot:1690213-Pyramimonas_sp.AAC.1